MSLQEEEQFDAMLSGFFKGALDPQLGRSERSFRRHLNDALGSAWRQRTWLIGAFMAGVAASVAMLWAGPLFRAALPSSSVESVSRANSGFTQTAVPAVERVVQSHTTDEGVMMLGNDTPVRVLRRQRIENTRRLDEQQQVHEERGTPEDEFVFVKVPTY
jgi:hypothetical protein